MQIETSMRGIPMQVHSDRHHGGLDHSQCDPHVAPEAKVNQSVRPVEVHERARVEAQMELFAGLWRRQFNTLTPLVYRNTPVRKHFPALRDMGDRHIEAVSGAYDYVLLWGDSGKATERLSAAGFEVVHEQQRLRILRNPRRLVNRDVDGAMAIQGAQN